MYYTIYKITNIINNKYYIGSHKTKNINDNYLGSGKLILNDIKIYGKENFKKEILFVFDNEIEMYEKESEIVTQFIIEQIENYNMCLGGKLTPKYFSDHCKVINEFGKVFITYKDDNRLLTNEIKLYKVKRNSKKKKQSINT
jgi:hypothetical protein